MPSLELAQGTINYRVLGPEASSAPPVVFVHGFWVDSRLWDKVAAQLAAAQIRCYLVDWPLGSHLTPLDPSADRSPRGIARIVLDFFEALKLTDVTLVGNDTGGAICQLLIDTDSTRIGRLVLTNCDAYDNFPPFPFNVYFRLGRRTALIRALLAPMRLRVVRNSPAGYGLLAHKPDPALTADWLAPARDDAGIREDTAAFLRGVDVSELVDVASRFGRFAKPVTLVWGQQDCFFKPEYARRLAQDFPNATLIEVPGARTFVSLDDPKAVVDAILTSTG